MIVTCDWQFLLTDVNAGADLPHQAEAVMQELLALEACQEGLSSSGVGLDLETMIVEISISAEADTYEDAVATAMSAIRSAIHAAGGSTLGWPQAMPASLAAPYYEPRGLHAVV
jgi:hypothetical protein